MTLASKWHHHGITVDLVELAERPTINAWWDLLARRAGQPTG
jgi:aryl carrier-like protein